MLVQDFGQYVNRFHPSPSTSPPPSLLIPLLILPHSLQQEPQTVNVSLLNTAAVHPLNNDSRNSLSVSFILTQFFIILSFLYRMELVYKNITNRGSGLRVEPWPWESFFQSKRPWELTVNIGGRMDVEPISKKSQNS